MPEINYNIECTTEEIAYFMSLLKDMDDVMVEMTVIIATPS
jgi:hypothetical protein